MRSITEVFGNSNFLQRIERRMTASEIGEETATQIEAIVDSWRDRLKNLDPVNVSKRPASDRWSISEVVGHLIDSACNNHQRFVRAQHGAELVFPKYEQNEWVEAADYQNCAWDSLVELWYHYNRMIAALIRNVPSAKLAVPCTITPYDTCSLEFLITDYLDHLRHHLGKLDERIQS